MDRYDYIASDGIPVEKVRCKSKATLSEILDTIAICIRTRKAFDSSKISKSLMDSAIVRYASEHQIPLIVKDSEVAETLRIAYSYNNIYSVKNFPSYLIVGILYRVTVEEFKKTGRTLIPVIMVV